MAPRRFQIIAGLSILTALVVLFAIRRNDPDHREEQNSLPEKSAKPESSRQSSGVNKFRFPAPQIQRGAGPSNGPKDAKAAEHYAQFHAPKLSIEQAEKFVAANQRSAASLVAAF